MSRLLATLKQQLGATVATIPARPPGLYYVASGAGWVIDWIGGTITRGMAEQFGWRAQVTRRPQRLSGQLIHYGELWAFLASLASSHNARNTIVATVFHGDRAERFPDLKEGTERFLAHAHIPARIVTASWLMEERLTRWGIPQEKVIRIPLGVDRAAFRPASDVERRERRKRLGIPEGTWCIGSFHKDGNGWAEGLTPKLIKGPDIFLRVIEQLSRRYSLHVLLTAPARGYVKQGLDSLGVPYTHRVLSDYRDLAAFYHCLDAYLVTSREEGGPLGVLEAMASGVPVVSTAVGMAPDVIRDGHNGLLAASEDVESLTDHAAQLIEGPELRSRLVANGLEDITAYDWRTITVRYHDELYAPLLCQRSPQC